MKIIIENAAFYSKTGAVKKQFIHCSKIIDKHTFLR